MLRINLAGYNVDAEVLAELLKEKPERMDATPETISAAYARISRDPRPVNELRAAARQEVEKARQSNRRIIFQMGHHSVAEHAVFNFDVLGISRLALEELEKFRLCSYTEKSQRYITLRDCFVVPQELRQTALAERFRDLAHAQFRTYDALFQRLKNYVFEANPQFAQDPKKHNLLEGWAKEDARLATPLATEAQLGLTVNARNLELILRRFASHPLAEIKQLGQELHRVVEKIAPSIILFHQVNDYDRNLAQDLRTGGCKIFGLAALPEPTSFEAVRLIQHSPQPDLAVLSALAHSACAMPAAQLRKQIESGSAEQKTAFLKEALKRLEFFDAVPREFEHAALTYELVVSAACFGQLKRHRMATMTCQAYDPKWGLTVPESIKAVGGEAEFLQLARETEEFYFDLLKQAPSAAPYVLMNAHRRRVLLTVNARELYHMSRLREDPHAQWDIRQLTAEMTRQAKKVMPLTMLLIGGKDKYPAIYKEVYGTSPKITPPD